jgi:Meckel syndrome type 1 protein
VDFSAVLASLTLSTDLAEAPEGATPPPADPAAIQAAHAGKTGTVGNRPGKILPPGKQPAEPELADDDHAEPEAQQIGEAHEANDATEVAGLLMQDAPAPQMGLTAPSQELPMATSTVAQQPAPQAHSDYTAVPAEPKPRRERQALNTGTALPLVAAASLPRSEAVPLVVASQSTSIAPNAQAVALVPKTSKASAPTSTVPASVQPQAVATAALLQPAPPAARAMVPEQQSPSVEPEAVPVRAAARDGATQLPQVAILAAAAAVPASLTSRALELKTEAAPASGNVIPTESLPGGPRVEATAPSAAPQITRLVSDEPHKAGLPEAAAPANSGATEAVSQPQAGLTLATPAPIEVQPAAPPALSQDTDQDIAALIDRIVEARAAAAPDAVRAALVHEEFGSVSLRLRTQDSHIQVTLGSADPGFAPAVHAAAAASFTGQSQGEADRREQSAPQPHHPAGHDASAQNAATSQQQQSSRNPASTGERTPSRDNGPGRSASEQAQQSQTAPAPDRRGGIYA